MKIKSLHIYPIKSLGGISLISSNLLERGLEYDRRWMLVDEHGVFLSQRDLPVLALFSVAIEDGLIIRSPNGASLEVNMNEAGEHVTVSIWDDTVKAVEVSKNASSWFSQELKSEVRLVYMPSKSRRLIDERYATNSEVVSFADGYPVLIANTASLIDLNSRLSIPIEIGRFRPNIVVEGATAFEEDRWANINIGTSKIEVVKKCARCVVVNINPATATKELEVLHALATYRKVSNKVLFGVNALVHQTGIIKVGDELSLAT